MLKIDIEQSRSGSEAKAKWRNKHSAIMSLARYPRAENAIVPNIETCGVREKKEPNQLDGLTREEAYCEVLAL